MSLRLSPELNARLEECAKRSKQKKHTLAQAAIEAAVAAIEASSGYLVVPIEFDVVRVPSEKPGRELIGERAPSALVQRSDSPETVANSKKKGAMDIVKRHYPKSRPGGPPTTQK